MIGQMPIFTIARAGGWDAYARAHRELLKDAFAKCCGRAVVDDVLGIMVDFLAPHGGW